MIVDLVQVDENSYLYTKRGINTSSWANTHKGETAIVIGNGGSLKDIPRKLLNKYPSFGVNHIYLLPFQPTYYVCMDYKVINHCSKEIYATVAQAKTAFLSWKFSVGHEELYELDNVYVCNQYSTVFPREQTASGGTSVYTALKIAYTMGFSTVLLVGCDRGGWGHFTEDYPFVKQKKSVLELQEYHLELAGEIYKAAGRRIVNLSLPSVLDEYFERGNIEDYA
jgi:hypothetical protein